MSGEAKPRKRPPSRYYLSDRPLEERHQSEDPSAAGSTRERGFREGAMVSSDTCLFVKNWTFLVVDQWRGNCSVSSRERSSFRGVSMILEVRDGNFRPNWHFHLLSKPTICIESIEDVTRVDNDSLDCSIFLNSILFHTLCLDLTYFSNLTYFLLLENMIRLKRDQQDWRPENDTWYYTWLMLHSTWRIWFWANLRQDRRMLRRTLELSLDVEGKRSISRFFLPSHNFLSASKFSKRSIIYPCAWLTNVDLNFSLQHTFLSLVAIYNHRDSADMVTNLSSGDNLNALAMYLILWFF